MILLDLDGKIAASPVQGYGSNWTIDETENGNHWAVSNSYFTEPTKANDWMITPVIQSININTVLNWDVFSYNSLFPEQYEIRVSPDGGSNPNDFTKIIYSIAEEGSEVTKRGLSLSEFAGNQIRIAFRNISFDKYLLYIDNIVVEDALRADVNIQDLKFEKYPLINIKHPIEFEIQNYGSEIINSLEFQITIGVENIYFTVDNLSIKYLEKYTVKSSPIVIHTIPEQVNANIKVIRINGNSFDNEPSSFLIHFLQNNWQRKMVAEALTSTHCAWCPKGIFYLDEINTSNPEDIITLSVHNGDIMTDADYEEGINSIQEFKNFPDVVLNRSKVIDPSNLETIINTWKNTVFNPARFSINTSKANRIITINGQLEFNTEFINSGLNIIAVISEDRVVGSGLAYDQRNIYSGGGLGALGGFENLPDPIPATQMIYKNVARELPFGFEGRNDLLNNTYAYGDITNFSVDFEIKEEYNIDNTSIILMLADNDGEIISAEKINLNTVSSDEVFYSNDITIFPNPTSGILNIKSELLNKENSVISIMNDKGQEISSEVLNGNSINLSNYSSGLYLLKIRNNMQTYIYKVIKI